jgi:hypothetical protein
MHLTPEEKRDKVDKVKNLVRKNIVEEGFICDCYTERFEVFEQFMDSISQLDIRLHIPSIDASIREPLQCVCFHYFPKYWPDPVVDRYDTYRSRRS